MQKQQSASNPPNELLRLIDEINLVSPDKELKTIENYIEIAIESLFEELKDFPEFINLLTTRAIEREKIMSPDLAEVDLTSWRCRMDVFSNYNKFVETRNALKIIVQVANHYNHHLAYKTDFKEIFKDAILAEAKRRAPDSVISYLALPSLSEIDLPIGFRLDAEVFSLWSDIDPDKALGKRFFETLVKFMVLTADEQHRIKIEWNGLMSLIQDCDLRRFRQCVECKKIFWAFRLDAKCCSAKCANKMRQKLFQNKNNDKTKIQRRKNYYYKNKIPFCDKCIRPIAKCECYSNKRSRK